MASESDTLNAKALELFERSLDHPSGERAGWIAAQADSKTIRDKALKYLSRDESGQGAVNTGGAFHDTLDDTAIPDQIGAYRITGLVGRGGMGSVYRGERASDDFDHDVAIKVVRPGAMSDKLVARFQTERQTLAKLIHPHIARLYDGGTLGSGAPYIVMEFIDGLPITDWAEKEGLSQDQRLKLFQDVCSAVSYAHQNLIIHRDITPSNVLVDKEGNVKLIDFGIAKPFDEDAAVTDMAHSLASMSFTPGFAAPERSKGAGANTLSDIYSLGKLLTALINDASDPELKAISTKATDLDPEKRYETVSALNDDIQHYIDGFPVEAMTIGSSYRTLKFISRHKLGTALTAFASLSLLTAFGVTLLQYQRAETAKIDADERFEEVHELANFMLFDLFDTLEPIAGNTQALNDISEKSKNYLDALGQDRRATPDLKLDIALSYKRLSDVMGNPKGANLGNREGAAEFLEKAYTDLKTLFSEDPDNPKIIRALAKTSYAYSTHKNIAEDDEVASQELARESVGFYEQLISKNVAVESDYLEKMGSAQQEAGTYIWNDQGEIGIEKFKILVEEIDNFVDTNPDSLKGKGLKASIYADLANTMSWHFDVKSEDYNDALTYMNFAVESYKSLDQLNPDDTSFKRSLVAVYFKRALIYYDFEDWQKVQDDLERAESIALYFLEIDENDSSMIRSLQVVRAQMVEILGFLGQFDRAIAMGDINHQQRLKMYQAEPTSTGRLRELTTSLHTQASVRELAGLKREACVYYSKALTNWKTLETQSAVTELDRRNQYAEIIQKVVECEKDK